MTTDDIIRMAREQGLPETEVEGVFMVNTDDLGRFAAAEREACADITENWRCNGMPRTVLADQIRARGQV
jgi:hypothetical protein